VAMAAMKLAEQRKIDLDSNVNRYLKSWKLPDSPYSLQEKATIRRILSHSAGLRGEGYPGYAHGEKVPALLQILDGMPPAKSKPVRLDTVPGVRWRYSGGGYLVLQQLLMDVTQKPFSDIMNSLVFKPLKMKNSMFAQPLPAKLISRAASGHQGYELEPGRWRNIPQVAAGGLWSTATDLALFVIEVQKSVKGRSNKILSASITEEMLKPQIKARHEYWSLGFNVADKGQASWFEHGGLTDGYISEMIGFVHEGNGVIILTNSQTSFPLIMEIVRGVANVYNWPAWGPTLK
ncbi:MAG TPA: serine hydrolase domain-containing protein, partial [Chitinophagaceae bacterium]|nr:serine hydrolase domain-containing protein [Chitinophagaceae bacterium]